MKQSLSSKAQKPRKIAYKSYYVQSFEIALMVLGATFLLMMASMGVILLRSTQEQESMETYISLLEKYKGDASIARETMTIIQMLSAQTTVPEGELPLIAVLTDKSQLLDIPLFELAENGDRIVFYVNAQKAYVYRPSIELMIAQGAFDSELLSKLTAKPTPPPSVIQVSSDSARMATQSGTMKEAGSSARVTTPDTQKSKE